MGNIYIGAIAIFMLVYFWRHRNGDRPSRFKYRPPLLLRKLPRSLFGKLLLLSVEVLLIFAAYYFLRNDSYVLLQLFPEAAAWFTTFDVAAYIDFAGAILLSAAALRLTATRDYVSRLFRPASQARRDDRSIEGAGDRRRG